MASPIGHFSATIRKRGSTRVSLRGPFRHRGRFGCASLGILRNGLTHLTTQAFYQRLAIGIIIVTTLADHRQKGAGHERSQRGRRGPNRAIDRFPPPATLTPCHARCALQPKRKT
jgi:hypothetical protein